MPMISPTAISPHNRRGISWQAYWATLISATVEDAAPTKVVLTFSQANITLEAIDFSITDKTISLLERDVSNKIFTITVVEPVQVFENDLYITLNKAAGLSFLITNSVDDDGNTVAWYDSKSLDTITKDVDNKVSAWADKLGSGNNLLQATDGNKPIYSNSGILFDGVNDKLRASFALQQPEFIYIVFKIKQWAYGIIFDGYTNASGYLMMPNYYVSPEIKCGAGTSSAVTDYVVNDTRGVVRVLFNGASSKLIINKNLPILGDFGSNDMGGFCLGSGGNLTLPSNIEVQEIIIRKVSDTDGVEQIIYNYIKRSNNVQDTVYRTLSEAVYKEEPESLILGNGVFNKNTEDAVSCGYGNDFVAKKIEDSYDLLGSDKTINCTLENPEIIRFTEDAQNCHVFDISGDYIYYGHSTAFYRINKHTFSDKVKFLISGIWDGFDVGGATISEVNEMNDLGLLIQIDIGGASSLIYKVPFASQTSGTKTYNELDAILAINLNVRYATVNKAWGVSCKGNRVFIICYGGIGQAYLSEDYGVTFKCVFSMADSSINAGVPDEKMIFVDTKPDGDGGYGAIGGHPMKDTLSNPQDYDLWGITANTNLHSHGGCIDRFADRLIIVTGDGVPAVGVYYSDDWGYTWTLISCLDHVPSTPKLQGTQFVNVITMEDVILFGSDGRGDGYWRLFRNGSQLYDRLENCFQFTGTNTILKVIAGGYYHNTDGITLGIINPEGADDYQTYKGGVIATKNGHDFKKLYTDSFSEFTELTAEIGWRSLISINSNNEVMIKAKNGGIIKMDYTH